MSLERPPKIDRSTARYVVRHVHGEGEEVRFHTNSLNEARQELARIAAAGAVGSPDLSAEENLARTWTPGDSALALRDGSKVEIEELPVPTITKTSPARVGSEDWTAR